MKYLSDCHGAEAHINEESITKYYFCSECGVACNVHEVKGEPVKEGHTLAGHMKSVLKLSCNPPISEGEVSEKIKKMSKDELWKLYKEISDEILRRQPRIIIP